MYEPSARSTPMARGQSCICVYGCQMYSASQSIQAFDNVELGMVNDEGVAQLLEFRFIHRKERCAIDVRHGRNSSKHADVAELLDGTLVLWICRAVHNDSCNGNITAAKRSECEQSVVDGTERGSRGE